MSRCLFCYKLTSRSDYITNFTCITCRFVNEHYAYKFGQFEYISMSQKITVPKVYCSLIYRRILTNLKTKSMSKSIEIREMQRETDALLTEMEAKQNKRSQKIADLRASEEDEEDFDL